jgi:tRNA modification GTPase
MFSCVHQTHSSNASLPKQTFPGHIQSYDLRLLRTQSINVVARLRGRVDNTKAMYIDGDTIVAAATPSGESAIAIVRLSGAACNRLSEHCWSYGCAEPRKAVYGAYKAIDGHIVDHCIFVYFTSDSSYTGEDMLEIYSHGNPLIVRQLIDDMLARGCRAAEPGEFTRRAFLNGKMDLTQAEAVQDMIAARSEAALEAARRQLDGSVGKAVNKLLERLLNIIAHLEAYIDFPEEDLPPESADGPIAQLVELQKSAKLLIATAPYSAMLREGARTVIAGAPNAGKSSLMNALLGENRAIVSPEPGTTRDYIEERLIVGAHLLRIVDTAGLHEARGDIEQQGIGKSMEQIALADLVLLVVDATFSPPPPPFHASDTRDGAGLIVVENKCDLAGARAMFDFMPEAMHVRVSALNSEGIPELRAAIVRTLDVCFKNPGRDTVLVSARHAEALGNMSNSIESAIERLRNKEPAELAASELREALASLEQIVGRIDNERILDLVFSKFCIGK